MPPRRRRRGTIPPLPRGPTPPARPCPRRVRRDPRHARVPGHVDEVAAGVGLSKPTLHHYFRDKEEPLVRVYSDVLDGSLRMARETVAAAPPRSTGCTTCSSPAWCTPARTASCSRSASRRGTSCGGACSRTWPPRRWRATSPRTRRWSPRCRRRCSSTCASPR
ncbi:TetR/AcrR family transcriptional regulator [Pseudonocardia sp. KRD-169]|uniref:TetR/AcrR family transcriptional regulator n=1 Tax=Pseudonocardia abyssalis TaxID=2792008 RepID=A0ABS6ULC8_9PSEU|nr:TetR/AcrR family transcriptional regulator [Pseudonocardia abyssalis]MBW0133032.1 TetR/AcrR family transcriptional regulator [Pseudonocardia abyssalis]